MTVNQTVYIEPKKSQASPMVINTMTNSIGAALMGCMLLKCLDIMWKIIGIPMLEL